MRQKKTALLSFIQGNKDLFSIIIIIIIINSTIHHSQEWFVWDKQASKQGCISNNEQNTKIPSIRPVSNACAKIKSILFGLIKKKLLLFVFYLIIVHRMMLAATSIHEFTHFH